MFMSTENGILLFKSFLIFSKTFIRLRFNHLLCPMDETPLEQTTKKYVTAIIFDKMHLPFFLLMKQKRNWTGWEFVKGKIEPGETELDAVRREIIEETGLQQI